MKRKRASIRIDVEECGSCGNPHDVTVVAVCKALGLRTVVAARNKDGSPAHLSRLPYTSEPLEIAA